MPTISLTGDYYCGESRDQEEFSVINDYLKDSQINVVNFEGSLHSNTITPKAVNLAMDEDALSFPNSTILSLSNNHILDFGAQGLQKTLKAIAQKDLSWFGLESKIFQGDNYKIIQCGDVNVCFVGFGWKNEECTPANKDHWGVSDYSQQSIERTFNRLQYEKYDYLIVYCHAGYEYEYYPLPLHVGLSRYLIDKGADFVYGSHTHCIQPYEIYKGKYIFYGLGNFYFSGGRERYPEDSDRGLVVILSVSKRGLSLERLDRIQYNRNVSGVKITVDSDFLDKNRLNIKSLSTYTKEYRQLRTRKKNPRPIMNYQTDFSNAVKYWGWLSIVRITGYLKIRKLVKQLLGWG